MENLTLEQAQELLVNLYKREIDNSEYYHTQTEFDSYVEEFCNEAGIDVEEISNEQLNECAYNFVEYDGGDYLIN